MKTETDWKDIVSAPVRGDHMVQVYNDSQFLCEAVGLYAETALRRNNAVILIARNPHLVVFRTHLENKGIDVQLALERGQWVALPAEETLNQFMRAGVPDASCFREVVGTLIEKTRRSFPDVCAYGEMVDILWHKGNRQGAIELESLWNLLAKSYPFSLMCGYGIDSLEAQVYGGALQSICSQHSHFIPARHYVRWETAVKQALGDILEPGEVVSLHRAMENAPPRTKMPREAAELLWLNEKLPILGAKVVQRAGQYYQIPELSPAA